MPAMVSTRTSWLTRTSCEPLISRLPSGSTSVTTAAIDRWSFSERSMVPSPLALVMPLARQAARRRARLLGHAETAEAEIDRHGPLGVGLFRAAAGVVELGLVVDVDGDGDDIADAVGAQVAEDALVAPAPQRIWRVHLGLGEGRRKVGARHGQPLADDRQRRRATGGRGLVGAAAGEQAERQREDSMRFTCCRLSACRPEARP